MAGAGQPWVRDAHAEERLVGRGGRSPFVGFGSARWGWAVGAGMGAALLSPVLRARLEKTPRAAWERREV